MQTGAARRFTVIYMCVWNDASAAIWVAVEGWPAANATLLGAQRGISAASPRRARALKSPIASQFVVSSNFSARLRLIRVVPDHLWCYTL